MSSASQVVNVKIIIDPEARLKDYLLSRAEVLSYHWCNLVLYGHQSVLEAWTVLTDLVMDVTIMYTLRCLFCVINFVYNHCMDVSKINFLC